MRAKDYEGFRTALEAMDDLGISKRKLDEAIDNGWLPVYRLDSAGKRGARYFKKEDVEKCRKEHFVPRVEAIKELAGS